MYKRSETLNTGRESKREGNGRGSNPRRVGRRGTTLQSREECTVTAVLRCVGLGWEIPSKAKGI